MADQAAEEPLAPIIVKKITIEEGGHHGGAWKVAYADFVTAMMAFFLLLWLLGATEENQRKGIADYFAPTLVKMRQQSAGSDGMLGGSSITDPDNYPNRQGQTGNQAITVPRGVKGGPSEGDGAVKKGISEQLEKIREQIDKELKKRQKISHLAKQVRVMRAPEGIRIDLVDDADFSMFSLGTTILTEEAQQLIDVISEIIKTQAAPMILRGHTDSLPYRAGVQANNWSLSAGRAEATRQQLIASGIPESTFARIEGVADTEPLVAGNPADPRNRRISLLLLDQDEGGRGARGGGGTNRRAGRRGAPRQIDMGEAELPPEIARDSAAAGAASSQADANTASTPSD